MSRFRKTALIALTLILALALTGCGSDQPVDQPVTVPTTIPALAAATATTLPTAAPTAPPTAAPTSTPEPAADLPAPEAMLYDFEDGTAQGWTARGDAVVAVVSDMAHAGTHSLLVSGRAAAWQGTNLDVVDLLEPGQPYAISAFVRLAAGQPASQLIITMQRTPTGGDTAYDWIAPSAADGVTADGWVELRGQYTFTGQADNLLLYIESPDPEWVDFYVDDFTISATTTPVASGPLSPQTDIPALSETFADQFLIGAAIEPAQLDSAPHAALLTRHFNSITAENAMKPTSIQPKEGTFTWQGADKLVQFATDHGLMVHGHTLVWHQQVPDWFFKDSAGKALTPTPENKALVLSRLDTHIRAVVGRYKDAVNVWDVVNEVIDPDQADCMRRSTWYELTGTDYIATAFLVAHEVAPDAMLILNDYGTTDLRKRACIYNFVQEMQAAGVPIQGIGMQMHINIVSPSATAVDETIQKFAELGQVHITEMDMSLYTNDSKSYDPVPDEILVRQGHRYQEMFDIFRRQADKIGSVTFWGMADDHTWLKTWPTTRINLPLLFDEQLQAKYAYWGVIDPSRLPALGQAVTPAADLPKMITAPFGTPVIDGEEDPAWAQAEAVTTGAWVMGTSGATATVRTLWDNEYLYVYAVVTDTLLSKAAANPWEQDSIEVYVDQNNGKTVDYQADDGQYRVNFDNEHSFGGAATEDRITSATRIIPTGYVVELAIKFDAVVPAEGGLIGFDFQVNSDEDGDGARDAVVTWNDPTGQSYLNTSRLGVLKFGK